MKLFLIVLLFICGFVIGDSIEKINFGIDSAKNGMYKKIVAQKSPVAVATPLSKMENPRIVIKKEKRRLELFDGEKLIKTYTVALGFAPTGDKEKQGDGKTPEGEFYIFTKNNQSKFYLSLGVSYPNIEDAHRGLEAKTITKNQYAKIVKAFNAKKAPPQNTKLGGDIYIHGGGTGRDWTWGCVALDNKNIKELFDTIPVGASVKIEP
jgi:murein L,D-transpeptidase YafK